MPRYADGIARDGGLYRVLVRVGGKQVKASFRTLAAARNAREQLRDQAEAIRLGIRPLEQAGRLTLGALFDGYLRHLQVLQRSELAIQWVGRARRYWCGGLVHGRRVPGAFTEAHTASLSGADCEAFVRFMRDTTTSKGRLIDQCLGIARSAMKRAGLPLPPPVVLEYERAPRRTVPLDELRAFLAAFPVGGMLRAYAETILRTGCRESEARRLTIGDVALESGVLTLRRRKGRRGSRWQAVAAPISPGLAEHLRAYLATQPSEPEAPLFAVRLARRGRSGRRPLTQPTAAKLVARACSEAGVPVRHGAGWLRNQTATMAREAGLSLDVTRRVLGHSESGTTERHYDQSTQWAARLAFAETIDREIGVTPGVQPLPPNGRKP